MDKINAVSDIFIESNKMVIFTGAGISTESGIPDFRSPGGIWDQYDPNELTYQKFLTSQASREKYWERQKLLWPIIAAAEPNAGHLSIAELHKMGKLDCIITQDGDSLHQRSGIPDEKVIELHGTWTRALCLDCSNRYPSAEVQLRLEAGEKVPTCEACGGVMKPDVIQFGQAMPERETAEAQRRAAGCDLLLACGSSMVVYPAAEMPLIAKNNGAKLVIINLMPTPHDRYADIVINEKIGEVLPKIVELAKDKRKK
ncbi:NAD-dependent deacetylase [Chloroflexota bacterium]